MNQNSIQPDQPDLRVRSYVMRWWSSLISLDGPSWQAFRKLVVAPGKLSAAQLTPVTKVQDFAAVHPIRLYLSVNIVFFLLAPWLNTSNLGVWKMGHTSALTTQPAFEELLSGAIERSGIEEQIFLTVLDQRMGAQQGALVWLLIPFLAFGSFAVCRRRRRFFVEHLVLATNLVSYFLVSLLLTGVIGRALLLFGASDQLVLNILLVVILAWLLWMAVTGYKSLRFFFELSHVRTGLLVLWQATFFMVGTMLYHQALFLFSLLSLRGLTAAIPG